MYALPDTVTARAARAHDTTDTKHARQSAQIGRVNTWLGYERGQQRITSISSTSTSYCEQDDVQQVTDLAGGESGSDSQLAGVSGAVGHQDRLREEHAQKATESVLLESWDLGSFLAWTPSVRVSEYAGLEGDLIFSTESTQLGQLCQTVCYATPARHNSKCW
ncbi:hypothetical protein BaRGS_00004427, partial [Batillaria attramentaria]